MSEAISVKEAYLAMYSFLNELYSKYGYEQLGGLLGGMSLLDDGATADNAMWHDWLKCIEKAKTGQVQTELRLYSKDQRGPQ